MQKDRPRLRHGHGRGRSGYSAQYPNLVTAWFLGGWVPVSLNGEPNMAIERFSTAVRTSIHLTFKLCMPALPVTISLRVAMIRHCPAAEHCLRDRPNYLPALFIVAASGRARWSRGIRTRMAIARIRELNPGNVPFSFQETEGRTGISSEHIFCEINRGPKKGWAPPE